MRLHAAQERVRWTGPEDSSLGEETARLIFYVILGAEIVAWVIAAHFSLRALGDGEGSVLGGELEAEGDEEELSRRIAESLAAGASPLAQGFRLTERTGERIAFERAMPGATSGPAQAVIDSGLVTFERTASGKVRIAYAAKVERLLRITRIGLLISLAAGIVALCVGAVLVWVLIIPNETPGVRWQVFQTFQVAQFLWEPWLFLGLRRRGKRVAKAYMETLVSNAALLGGPSAGE